MSETVKSLYEQKVESVAKELAAKGYKVMVEPSFSVLPFDLGNYRPDLVAFKGDGGIILEVKTSHTRLSVDRYQEIAESISAHEGWRFLLVTLDDVNETILPEGQDDLPSWKALQSRIGEIDKLLQNHMVEPALLYLWSTMEATLRSRAIGQKLPIERFQSIALLNHMYSSGEIDFYELDLIKSIFEKRNRVAHGLVTSLHPNELEEPKRVISSLIEKWQESHTNNI